MNLIKGKVSEKDIEILKLKFNNYVKSFLNGDEKNDSNIILKQKHTFRVCEEITKIANDLNLDENLTNFCKGLALFHDLGRFQQYYKYKTFVDADSINHAALSCKLTERMKLISFMPKSDQKLFKRSILFHNIAEIPARADKSTIFFSKILRDADKLDIWYVLSSYYLDKKKDSNSVLELGLEDKPGLSENVFNSIMNESIVLKEDMNNKNDFKMMQMGWVYDLNFNYSFKTLMKKEYLKKIKSVLPKDSIKINKACEKIFDYISHNVQTQQLQNR